MKKPYLAAAAAVGLLLLILGLLFFLRAERFDCEAAALREEKPPVVCAADGSGARWTVGAELDVCRITVDGREGSCLFLPASRGGGVLLRYTGGGRLYLPEERRYVEPGETFRLDLPDGDHFLYEELGEEQVKYPLTVRSSQNLTAVYMELDGGAERLAAIHADKANAGSGRLRVVKADGSLVYDDALTKCKAHGNTSFIVPGLAGDKYSYNIKLKTKTELIDGAGAAKKWVLLHIRAYEGYDCTGLMTSFALRTFAALAGEEGFAAASEMVELYINGDYRGTYVLTERADNNAAVRVTDMDKHVAAESAALATVSDPEDPVIAGGIREYTYTADAVPADEGYDVTGGYVLECAKDWEGCGFRTRHGLGFYIKAPEVCTREQVQYIASYVQDFEDALTESAGYNRLGKHYTEYIDVRSLADMILTYAYYQNWELFRTSTYLCKDVEGSANSLLTFGPAWDFETGPDRFAKEPVFFSPFFVYNVKRQYLWLEKLWEKGDFLAVLTEEAQRLNEYAAACLGDGPESLQSFYDRILAAQNNNWVRWDLAAALGGPEHSWEACFREMAEAFETRYRDWTALTDTTAYLYGVTCEEQDGLLTVVTDCQAELKYQWYLYDAWSNGLTPLSMEVGPTIQLKPDCQYVCKVTGPSAACYPEANSDFFRSETVEIYTPAWGPWIPPETGD